MDSSEKCELKVCATSSNIAYIFDSYCKICNSTFHNIRFEVSFLRTYYNDNSVGTTRKYKPFCVKCKNCVEKNPSAKWHQYLAPIIPPELDCEDPSYTDFLKYSRRR